MADVQNLNINQRTYEISVKSIDKVDGLRATLNGMQSDIEALQGVGRFVALWNAATGLAYSQLSSDPFVYQSGDYFIVGTISEDSANFKPTGSEYREGVPSREEETGDIFVNDMYFYNGDNWTLLPSHSKQIAIDSELSLTSPNPVENRVITEALNGKQEMLIAGAGIDITGNTISTTGGGGGGDASAGLPVIANVDVRRISNQDKWVDRVQNEKDYRGSYGDIVFTTNMSRETLVKNMNDLYVCIARRQRGFVKKWNDPEDDSVYTYKTIKYGIMNDRRVKSTKKMYCWLYREDSGIPFDLEHFHEENYYFYYTENDYESVEAMLNANPEAYTWLGKDYRGDYTTCLNTLRDSGVDMQGMTGGDIASTLRYEAGDIDTFVNKRGYMYKSYTDPDTEEYVAGNRLQCRECTSTGGRYFAWCLDWDSDDYDVYINIDSLPEFIPEHFVIDTDIVEVDKATFLATYTVGNYRADLDICLEEDTIDSVIDKIALGEENLPYWFENDGDRPYGDEPLRGSKGIKGHYWFEHAVMPVRIADCEVLIDDVYTDTETSISGTWMKFKDYIKLDESKLSTKHILFRFPYATDYLALRMCGWEKWCLTTGSETNIYNDGEGVGYRNEIARVGWYSEDYLQTPFGKPAYRGSNRMLDLVQFNLLTADDLVHSKLSQSTGVNKKLAILAQSGKITTTLAN